MGRSELQNQLDTLRESLEFCEAELSMLPEGTLLCSRDKSGHNRYYRAFSDDSGVYQRRGIGKQAGLKKDLARKAFLEQAAKAMRANVSLLEKTINAYIPCDPDSVLSRMRSGLQNLPSDDMVCTRVQQMLLDIDGSTCQRIDSHVAWGNAAYKRSERPIEGIGLVTSRGERMRSKSELLIAERLYAYGIAFHYEQLIEVGQTELAPDFTFQDCDSNEFYLEFCGMMNDPAYVSSYQHKRDLYEQAGITQWGRMIYVYASGNEIDMEAIDATIRYQIIPRL